MVAYYWVEILPEDYIVDVSQKGDGSICMLQFRANTYDFLVFGLPFFQNYYITFDMENVTATFVPNAGTRKGYPQLDRNLPTKTVQVSASNTSTTDGSSYGANRTTTSNET